MKTSLPYNNFSSGQIDRALKGRVDIPLYQHGHEISENFCETIKGDVLASGNGTSSNPYVVLTR